MIEVFKPGFKRAEFACRCGCGFDTVDAELLAVLYDVREHFNKSVTITSGCRCIPHNREIGGAEGSKHTLGIAADIQVKDVQQDVVHEYLTSQYPNKYGIGLYKTWVHVDVRSNGPARWNDAD